MMPSISILDSALCGPQWQDMLPDITKHDLPAAGSGSLTSIACYRTFQSRDSTKSGSSGDTTDTCAMSMESPTPSNMSGIHVLLR